MASLESLLQNNVMRGVKMRTRIFLWLMISLAAAAICGCRTAELRVEHPQTGVRVTCKLETVEESMR